MGSGHGHQWHHGRAEQGELTGCNSTVWLGDDGCEPPSLSPTVLPLLRLILITLEVTPMRLVFAKWPATFANLLTTHGLLPQNTNKICYDECKGTMERWAIGWPALAQWPRRLAAQASPA